MRRAPWARCRAERGATRSACGAAPGPTAGLTGPAAAGGWSLFASKVGGQPGALVDCAFGVQFRSHICTANDMGGDAALRQLVGQ